MPLHNGHLGEECYHALFCFNQFGDLVGATLRPGNVHSAEDWHMLLKPIVERYRSMDIDRFFRGDATFAKPEIYRFLENEHYLYAIRLPANQVLHREIEDLTKPPPGWPLTEAAVKGWPGKGRQVRYKSFRYRAGSWQKARRVVAKVEWHPSTGSGPADGRGISKS